MSEKELSSSSSSSSSSSDAEESKPTEQDCTDGSRTNKEAPTSATNLASSNEPSGSSDDKGNEFKRESSINGNRNRSSNSNNNSKSKKRKRKRLSEEDEQQELVQIQVERYDRLLYNAKKQLHKVAKQTKTFLLQKEIRKKPNNKNNGSSDLKLELQKTLDLDVVTSQAIRQLGLYHCDPRFKLGTNDDAEDDNGNGNSNGVGDENGEPNADADPTTTTTDAEPSTDAAAEAKVPTKGKRNKKQNRSSPPSMAPPVIPAPLAPDDPRKPLVDAVLTHKRFGKSLEEWNEKVTEYRRWCMKLEQRNNPNPFGDDYLPVRGRKKKKSGNNTSGGGSGGVRDDLGLQATVENESSLFCTLGGGDDSYAVDPSDPYSAYGPAASMDAEPKKKNRKGQRQRRAKALALEAKKQGRSHEHYQSVNWREPKPKSEGDNEHGDERPRKSRGRGKETNRNQRRGSQYSNDYSSGGNDRQQQQQQQQQQQDAEPQHPSWAAKQAQSTGIVAFQGKKITFD